MTIVHDYKLRLNQFNVDIEAQMNALGTDGVLHIGNFITQRAMLMDNVLTRLFNEYFDKNKGELALFAVGGYGRRELFAHSDVDILLLGDVDAYQMQIEQFVATLWSIGITPAIAVRTPAQSYEQASEPTIATALIEARLITGTATLANIPAQSVKRNWDMASFYHAKRIETKARHHQYDASEYNLEPNVKDGVGGLRDIHIITWLALCCDEDISSFDDLIRLDFIDTIHHQELVRARAFLWCVRHHLHSLAGRGEDKLLFDYQRAVAMRMGYLPSDNNPNHAPEALMKDYYYHVMTIASLSELFRGYFALLANDDTPVNTPLDDDFIQVQYVNGSPAIAIQDTQLFYTKPATLLSIFLMMGKHAIKRIAPQTLSALSLASMQIDDAYRACAEHRALFLANLQHGDYLYHRLRLMKRYGVLGRYLPAFGQIIGLMQYDLFHRYTVDAHTLLLIRILRRLGDLDNEIYQQKFELVSQIYQQINRKDILTIAAIFHDIAKGRGGDHSELGAIDTYEFCLTHGMSRSDADFTAWLVREHLTMSLTAQKQDIDDPQVVGKFARFVKNITRLNHLYVLTVADMNATNSQLWNNWRASLLKRLYLSTYQVLTIGEAATDKERLIQAKKLKVKRLLPDTNLDVLWQNFTDEYFLSQSHRDIAWQMHEIITHQDRIGNNAIISLQSHADLALDAMQLFICLLDRKNLFALTVCVLDKFGLSVMSANIVTVSITNQPCALDNYIIIDKFAKRDAKGALMSDFLTNPIRQDELRSALINTFNDGHCLAPSPRIDYSRHRHFSVPTQIHFRPARSPTHHEHHTLELITKDRPALLATIGMVFYDYGVQIHGARITTMGERAEDVFYVSGRDGKMDIDEQTALTDALTDALA